MPGNGLIPKFHPSQYDTPYESNGSWDEADYEVQPSSADGSMAIMLTLPHLAHHQNGYEDLSGVNDDGNGGYLDVTFGDDDIDGSTVTDEAGHDMYV